MSQKEYLYKLFDLERDAWVNPEHIEMVEELPPDKVVITFESGAILITTRGAWERLLREITPK